MNNNLILSAIPIEDLKTVISDVVNEALQKRESQTQSKQDEYLTRKVTASILGISDVTLDKYTREGRISGYRVGSRVRYKKNEIEQALKQIKSLKNKIVN